VIALVGACASTDFGPHGAVMITPESAGRTIELQSGQELLVRLPSNPATGYRWALEGLPSFERNPNGANTPSAPGFEIWRFTLARKGQQVLTFDYRLPWDGDAPPAHQLSFTVTVR
jgi:inhibitor of cysteine peptidase